MNANFRIYFNPDATTVFFADAGINYNITAKDFTGSLSVGLNWFLSSNIALESSVGTRLTDFEGVVFNNRFKYFFNHSESDLDEDKENLLYRGNWVFGVNNSEGLLNSISEGRLDLAAVDGFFVTILSTSVGRFVSNGLVLGSQVNYNVASFEDTGSIHELGIIPYLRMYPFDTAQDFTFFLELGAGANFLGSTGESDITSFFKGIGACLLYTSPSPRD